MKQNILIIVVMFVIATFFIIADKQSSTGSNSKKNKTNNSISEVGGIVNPDVKAMYVSYIELEEYIKDKSSDVAKSNIDTIINNMKKDGFNWLILHVRPFSDSIYPSKIFPNSGVVTDGELPFDILAYFIEKAHSAGIKVHAWINPYRISSDPNFVIDEKHPAHKFLNTNSVKVIDGKGVYYNPASEEVIDLIVSGVEEIIKNYDVDGIHFDDYFYPSEDIDDANYDAYQKSGGTLSRSEYRLDNTTKLISRVYEMIKKNNKKILFGIAPEGNIDNNYSTNFLDVKKLLSTSNYLDYVMPQLYYGFLNQNRPYADTLKEWSNMIKDQSIALIPALALYKSGNDDQYAGSGKNEWKENDDIIKRQILYSQNIPNYKGFSIFRYAFFYDQNSQNANTIKEVKNIRDVI